jgi:hypothetical protein
MSRIAPEGDGSRLRNRAQGTAPSRNCVVSSCCSLRQGGVAEWLNAPVLKTGMPQGIVGSNPTPSASEARDRGCLYSGNMKRPARVSIVVIAVAALVILLLAGSAWWAASLAKVASGGKGEAEAGVARLRSLDATGAASQFDAAKRSFSRADALLGPGWLGAAADKVPLAGRQYSTARALVSLGLRGSTAGAELAAVLQAAPTDRAGAGATSSLGSLVETRRRRVEAALTALLDAADRATSLDERGLVPPLARQVRSVKAVLRDAGPILDRGRGLLALEKYLLSSTRRLLVVSQNGAELRPPGGFSGSYGVIDVGPTGVRLMTWQDIYTLPDPPYRDVFLMPYVPDGFTPPPDAAPTNEFGFREANWWIDFPTSARAMLGFWRDYGLPPVDAVVVVDTVAIQYLLEALGPITVPSFSETFTPENLLTRLLYYTMVKGGEGRKDVLVALAGELEQRVIGASPGELAKAAKALAKAADAKHVQLYFTDPGAEAAITSMGWSGRIAPPGGATDVLVISNAMNLGSKINMAMKKTIDYQVALAPDRSAESTLTLGYSNTGPYSLPGRNSFDDWLRISRAPGTVFPPGGGGYGTVESGLPTEVRTFSVLRGQTREESVVSRVPAAWRTSTAPSYRLFIARQADLEDIPVTVTVTPPPGWSVSRVVARLTASGAALPATIEDGTARLAAPLSGDTIFDVALARN